MFGFFFRQNLDSALSVVPVRHIVFVVHSSGGLTVIVLEKSYLKTHECYLNCQWLLIPWEAGQPFDVAHRFSSFFKHNVRDCGFFPSVSEGRATGRYGHVWVHQTTMKNFLGEVVGFTSFRNFSSSQQVDDFSPPLSRNYASLVSGFAFMLFGVCPSFHP